MVFRQSAKLIKLFRITFLGIMLHTQTHTFKIYWVYCVMWVKVITIPYSLLNNFEFSEQFCYFELKKKCVGFWIVQQLFDILEVVWYWCWIFNTITNANYNISKEIVRWNFNRWIFHKLYTIVSEINEGTQTQRNSMLILKKISSHDVDFHFL